MRKLQVALFTAVCAFGRTGMFAQQMKYAPLSEYMMPEDAEAALAKSPPHKIFPTMRRSGFSRPPVTKW